MKIGKDKVVELEYELIVDGVVADRTTPERGPLDYIHGAGMLLPKFEQSVEGLGEGDEFCFSLAPEDGYGEYLPEKIIELNLKAFEIDGVVREDLLEPGKVIPMLNSMGMVERGMVVSVDGGRVTMDFNVPLAGKTLNFSGKVVSVRDATEKELTEGLHGEFLPKEHCCHGKGKGCCHGEGHKEGGCCHGEHDSEGCGCEDGCSCHEDGGCHCGDDCGCQDGGKCECH